MQQVDSPESDFFYKNNLMDPKFFDEFELDQNTPCDIIDLPLQRWNHICIVLWNKSLDVYLNGKLRRSCALSGIPKFNGEDIYLFQNGGFDGELINLRYFNHAKNAAQVYDIYKSGVNNAFLPFLGSSVPEGKEAVQRLVSSTAALTGKARDLACGINSV
jgi:hypothetical protein